MTEKPHGILGDNTEAASLRTFIDGEGKVYLFTPPWFAVGRSVCAAALRSLERLIYDRRYSPPIWPAGRARERCYISAAQGQRVALYALCGSTAYEGCIHLDIDSKILPTVKAVSKGAPNNVHVRVLLLRDARCR